MRFRSPSHPTVVAYVALFFAMSGTAIAATGGTFILGKSNYAGVTTTLTNPNGTALRLQGKGGTPPLSVNNNVRIPYLNSDLLDGLHAADFLRSNGKARDANLLDGIDSSQFLRPTTGRAFDSSRLGGQLPSAFQRRVIDTCAVGTFMQGIYDDGRAYCAAPTPPPSLSGGHIFVHAGTECLSGTTFRYLIRLTDDEGLVRNYRLCEIN